MMSKAQTMRSQARQEFDSWAGSYDRSLLNRFMFRPSYLAFLEELYVCRKDLPGPFSLLDVGCGTGTFAGMLAATSLPAEIVGLDYSAPMCQVASGKAHQVGLHERVRFVTADSEHLPFADGSFDVVTCSNSFHHYPHQQNVVTEVRRILRPGGRFMLIDGFRDNIVGWVTYDVIIAAVEKHVHHAPWSVIDGYFKTAGFREIRRRKLNFWFPLLLTVGVV
ncbi:MAG: class I SAM-dependent methyltransferase [Planctomycetes bacterium]|nr:class I SAM-dependent methyltransferase [Planctomycetota bacterium]